jgi:hypothetical protein
MSWRFTSLSVLAATQLLVACSSQSSAAMRCHKSTPLGGDTFDLLFDASGGRARLLTTDEPVEGQVSVTETHYVFSFPASASRFAVQVAVQRLSGDLAWEMGKSPFGGYSESNVRWTGRCEKIDANPAV